MEIGVEDVAGIDGFNVGGEVDSKMISTVLDLIGGAFRGRIVKKELKKEKDIIDKIDRLLRERANHMSDEDLTECFKLLERAREEHSDLERLSQDFSTRWSRTTVEMAQGLTKTCIASHRQCERRSKRTDDGEVEEMLHAARASAGPEVRRPEPARPVASAHAKVCDYILLVSRRSPPSSSVMAAFIETLSKLNHAEDDDLVALLTAPSTLAFKEPPILITIEARWRKATQAEGVNFWQSCAKALLGEAKDDPIGHGTARIHVAMVASPVDNLLVASDLIGYDLDITGVMSWKLTDGRFKLLIGEEAFSNSAVIDKVNGAITDHILDKTFSKSVGRMVRTMKLDRIVLGPNEPVVDGTI